jgi:hypothetical protein
LLPAVAAAAMWAGGCASLPAQTAPVDPAQLVGHWRSVAFTGPFATDFAAMSLNFEANGTFESGTRFIRGPGSSLDGTYKVDGRKLLLNDVRGFRLALPFHLDRDTLMVLRPSRIGRVRVTLKRYVWKPPPEEAP